MMHVEDFPSWFVWGVAFVFGALWGSFFNVAIYRWPRGMSVVSPPSHCPACSAPIPAYRNIPIFAYVLQRGRTVCCHAPLAPRYVFVEALCGVLCVALAEKFFLHAPEGTLASEAAIHVLLYFLFVGALVVATFTDLEWMMIPDEVTLPGAALGLLSIPWRDVDAIDMAVGAGTGFLLVQLLFVWSYERLMGRRGMGEGDAKFLLLIGAFLGWRGVVFSIAAGSIQGVIVAAIMFVRKKDVAFELQPTSADFPSCVDTKPHACCEDREGEPVTLHSTVSFSENDGEEEDNFVSGAFQLKMPFGPFLALGALEWLFWGPSLLDWYLSFLG